MHNTRIIEISFDDLRLIRLHKSPPICYADIGADIAFDIVCNDHFPGSGARIQIQAGFAVLVGDIEANILPGLVIRICHII